MKRMCWGKPRIIQLLLFVVVMTSIAAVVFVVATAIGSHILVLLVMRLHVVMMM